MISTILSLDPLSNLPTERPTPFFRTVCQIVMSLLKTIVLILILSYCGLWNALVFGNSLALDKAGKVKKKNHEAFLRGLKKSKKAQKTQFERISKAVSSQLNSLPNSSLDKASLNSQLDNNPIKNADSYLPIVVPSKPIVVPSSKNFISAALQVQINDSISMNGRNLQGNLKGRNQ